MQQRELEEYWKAHTDGYKKGWEVGYERCMDIIFRLNELKDSDFGHLIDCLEKFKEIIIRDPLKEVEGKE
jgi:hypothetical protein